MTYRNEEKIIEDAKIALPFVECLRTAISEISDDLGCKNSSGIDRSTTVSFLLIQNALMVVHEYKECLVLNRNLSLALLNRFAYELATDYIFIFYDETKTVRRSNAWFLHNNIKHDELKKDSKIFQKHPMYEEWKKVSDGTNPIHWSGVSRTDTISEVENFLREGGSKDADTKYYYKIMCLQAHPSFHTTEHALWNESNMAAEFLRFGHVRFVWSITDMYLLALKKQLCGVSLEGVNENMALLESNLESLFRITLKK